ncbi:hypothetical protein K438DRAFT_1788138 [Mycena galopus ATCC 62051]|nr:hypothetical protein K438DRAFT_1788138 [Mycena galopus ATCC 62051]
MSLEPPQEFQYTDYLAAMCELNVRGYPHSNSENSTLDLRPALGLNLTSAEQEGIANHSTTYTGRATAWLYLLHLKVLDFLLTPHYPQSASAPFLKTMFAKWTGASGNRIILIHQLFGKLAFWDTEMDTLLHLISLSHSS